MRRFDNGSSLKDQKGLWAEYCGFLDLSIQEYMAMQERLLLEQVNILNGTGLGRRFFDGAPPKNIDEFRARIPLTTYEDYADILLNRREDMLPQKPSIWIRTTWEGGKHPIKYAPYTPSMLEAYRRNLIAAMMLATSSERGKTSIRAHDKILYGLAPLPYATGLFPHVIESYLTLDFLPPLNVASSMSMSDASKLGFKMGLKDGMDLFFGMASVACRIGEKFTLDGQKEPEKDDGESAAFEVKTTPGMAVRAMRARSRARKEGRGVRPKDAFSLKGLVIAGTDSAVYKEKIQEQWGIRPHEVSGGTESTIIGTETWTHDGMIFFPDSNFYEFIPETDMRRNSEDPSFVPRTLLMNELKAGENYEAVLTTLHGGAFLRYRLGDMYRCVAERDNKARIDLPVMQFIDRVPDTIDIAGFTRITAETIDEVLRLSRLELSRYIAVKDYDDQKRPYMKLYVEMDRHAVLGSAATERLVKDHISAYFHYVDSDYGDLKRLLGMDPLTVELLPMGCIEDYERETGRKLRPVNPPRFDVIELLRRVRPTRFN